MSNNIQEFTLLTSSNVAYATGDTIGNLCLSITSNSFQAGVGQLLQSMVVRDSSHVNMAIDLVLFHKAPLGTTTTDNARLQIATQDINSVLDAIVVNASDYRDFNGSSVAVKQNLAIPVIASIPGNTIYGIPVARGTQTYSSTSALSFGLKFS